MSRDVVVMRYVCPQCGNRWKTEWSPMYCQLFNPKFIDCCTNEECEAFVIPDGVTNTKAEMRSLVWAKTSGICWYCDAELDPFTNYEMDHVVPRSRGGLDIYENLVPTCKKCNRSKGAKHLKDWKPE